MLEGKELTPEEEKIMKSFMPPKEKKSKPKKLNPPAPKFGGEFLGAAYRHTLTRTAFMGVVLSFKGQGIFPCERNTPGGFHSE